MTTLTGGKQEEDKKDMTLREAKYKVALYLKCWCDKEECDEYIVGLNEADFFTDADEKTMHKAFAFFREKLLREMDKYKLIETKIK